MISLAVIDYQHVLNRENLLPVIRVVIMIFIVIPIVLMMTRAIRRLLKGRVSEQHAMLVGKLFSYFTISLLIIMSLREMGFKLTTLLGAAGIAGVAVGFAAQTSLSNLISGIFLVWEKTFVIGDVIKVGETIGTVKSIDLLSIKLRTFDNKLIRIPNETLVKSEMSNITAYDIRRLDIPVGVAHGTDLERAMEVLTEIARLNPKVMDEPKPFISLTGFGESSVNILFGVWFAKVNFQAVRDSSIIAIHKRFAEEGIKIPFPQRTLHMAAANAFPGSDKGGLAPEAVAFTPEAVAFTSNPTASAPEAVPLADPPAGTSSGN